MSRMVHSEIRNGRRECLVELDGGVRIEVQGGPTMTDDEALALAQSQVAGLQTQESVPEAGPVVSLESVSDEDLVAEVVRREIPVETVQAAISVKVPTLGAKSQPQEEML